MDALDVSLSHYIAYHIHFSSTLLSSTLPILCAESFDHFIFSKTFLPMLWITSINFHVRLPNLKLETAAESSGACAAHEMLIG